MKETLNLTHRELLPQEQLCRIESSAGGLFIGLPCEKNEYEKRFPLTPEAVALLTSHGHRVMIESHAGERINYSDLIYAEAGAEVTENIRDVYQADIILKIEVPDQMEVELMKPGATVISLFQSARHTSRKLQRMMVKRICGIAFDRISDGRGAFPFADYLAEIDGNASVMLAAHLLSNQSGGKGILFGAIPGINPSEVLIFGCGLAGCAAARASIGLGALVKMFDFNIGGLRTAYEKVGRGLFTSTLHPQVVENALRTADVVIGAARIPGWMLGEDQLRLLKKGALLIDLCMDQGGCFETSGSAGPGEYVFEKYGLLHYCLPNISTTVARTASVALSNLFVPLLLQLAGSGNVLNYMKSESGFRDGVYLYNGKLVNAELGHLYNLLSYDLSLFFTAF